MLIQTCFLILYFLIYWLGLVPLIVYLALDWRLLQPGSTQQFIIQYGSMFLVFCVIYIILRRLIENCFTKHEIRRRLRAIVIQQQLEQLERGHDRVAVNGRYSATHREWLEHFKRLENVIEMNVQNLIEMKSQINLEEK